MASSLLWEGDELWVVACYYNAHGDRNRERNAKVFARNLKRQGVPLLMVELCSSADAPGLPQHLFTKYVRVLHTDELWCKEALLNHGIAHHLPRACSKIAWVDADVVFLDDWWHTRTAKLLDTHPVVQPFDAFGFLSDAETATPRRRIEPHRYLPSFAHTAATQGAVKEFRYAHPGYAWAARRDVLEQMGGLYTNAVLGLADVVMGFAFAAKRPSDVDASWSYPDVKLFMGNWNDAMVEDCKRWQHAAQAVVRGNLGAPCAQVAVHHLWHGTIESRRYNKIGKLIPTFDPAAHVAIDVDGLLHWTAECPDAVRDTVKRYFKSRKS